MEEAEEAVASKFARSQACNQALTDIHQVEEANTSLNGWIAAVVFCGAILIGFIIILVLGMVAPWTLRWVHTVPDPSPTVSKPLYTSPGTSPELIFGGNGVVYRMPRT